LIIVSANETEVGTAIFTESTDFQGLSFLIRRICENPRFLLVAESIINARNPNTVPVGAIG